MQPRPSRTRPPGAAPEQTERIQRLLQGFATNPTDLRAFKTLEEHLFPGGSAWTDGDG